MNSALTKVSNLKINRSSKIALTITFSSFFLYALGQAPILKNLLSCFLSRFINFSVTRFIKLYFFKFWLLSLLNEFSFYIMHRIYFAATMGDCLCSYDSKEFAYYNKPREKIDDMKKYPIKKWISLTLDTIEVCRNQSE